MHAHIHTDSVHACMHACTHTHTHTHTTLITWHTHTACMHTHIHTHCMHAYTHTHHTHTLHAHTHTHTAWHTRCMHAHIHITHTHTHTEFGSCSSVMHSEWDETYLQTVVGTNGILPGRYQIVQHAVHDSDHPEQGNKTTLISFSSVFFYKTVSFLFVVQWNPWWKTTLMSWQTVRRQGVTQPDRLRKAAVIRPRPFFFYRRQRRNQPPF